VNWIELDHTNLLADMVGEANGVTRQEIEECRPRAIEALRSFRKRYEAGDVGFPDLPSQAQTLMEIGMYAANVQGSFDTVCLIGIGGSALGAWALDCGLRGPHPVQGAFTRRHPRLVILDNVDPAFVKAALDSMLPRKTLAVVVAKSGSTAETMATFLIVRERLKKHVVVVTTDGKGDLFNLARQERFGKFYLPENVGGRFSVLSAVGLLPAALIGINIKKLAHGAATMTRRCWLENLNENVALRAALLHHLIWTKKGKTIQVAFPYSNRLWGTAFWFRQLWAESLGKARRRGDNAEIHAGQTPVAALGTTDQHSQVQLYIEGPNDKVFTFWGVEDFGDPGKISRKKLGLDSVDYLAGQSLEKLIHAEQRATAAALTRQGRPNCTFTLRRVDEEHLGAFLQMMEFETAFMGELLDVNAFDQEGVELGKKYTFGLMGRAGYDEYRNEFEEYEKHREKARMEF
jgi:glucose-6-phosphate isomerase